MDNSHSRKIQAFAKYSYAVTLPIHWIKKNKLERTKSEENGEITDLSEEPTVEIFEMADGSLQIYPQKRFKETEEVIHTIDVDELLKRSPNFYEDRSISMLLISYYMNGTAGVEIISKQPFSKQFIDQVERIQNRLLFNWNTSVINNRRILVKNVFTESQEELFDKDIPRYLRDSFSILLGMIEDILNAIQEKDYDSLIAIPERDIKIDRYYFFIVRQIRNLETPKITAPIIYDQKKLVDLRLLAKLIEEVGDFLKEISTILYKLHIFIDEIGLHEYLLQYFIELKNAYSILADILRNFVSQEKTSLGMNPEIMAKIQSFRLKGRELEAKWIELAPHLKFQVEKHSYIDFYQGARLIKDMEDVYTQIYDFTNLFF